jgi:hypothetical protein
LGVAYNLAVALWRYVRFVIDDGRHNASRRGRGAEMFQRSWDRL